MISTTNPKLSRLLVCQSAVGLAAASVGYCLRDLQLGASIAVGAGLMMLNVFVLGWSWQRLFAKKSIAWTSLIIVIKYAVLLGSIFYLAKMEWFSPLGAGIGIISFIGAALVWAALT